MIARLTLDDLATATQIHSESFEKSWQAGSLKTHIDNDICFGVFSEDARRDLSGFVIIRPAADQAEIITIAVSPALRGAGLGGALITHGCQALKAAGVLVVFLEVAEDNLAAIALYKNCGFAPIGRRPAYYRREGGRVAALTYRKDLSA